MKPKKVLLLPLSVLALSIALVGCSTGNGGQTDDPEPNVKEEEIKIEVPAGEDVVRLPAPVQMPDNPQLPATDPEKAPYIGAYGASTEAYSVALMGDAIAEGLSIGYPAQGKTLEAYNYIWLDVYNYQSEYSVIRFDFEEISGAEKVAVSAYYTEAYGTGLPPVGILVESLMDGEMSYVTDLSDFYTADENYKETDGVLSAQTVCRLFVYFDSNPAQNPSDAVGSIKLASVSFHKPGDPATVVDNSPRLGEARVSGEGIALAQEGVFTASYTPVEMTEQQYIGVPVERFTGAYGTVRFTYTATGGGKLTVTDGVNVLGVYDIAASGAEAVDIRGYSRLGELRFYPDSYSGAGESQTEHFFTLETLELIYTPYVTADWDSTSKFHYSDAALGGKVKAMYDQDVGYDYLHVPVKYWTREYSQMTVKFKTSGTAPGDTGAERYGLSVNSNNVLLEVAYNKISDLPYDENTGEYTLTVDLSRISKLATLNFFFDSIAVQPFNGMRTVEFTSIEFSPAAPGLTVGRPIAYNGFTVEDGENGSYDVSWTADKEAAYIGVPVNNWTGDYTSFTVTVENTGDTAAKFAVYRGDWSTQWLDHTEIAAADVKTFTVPVVDGREQMELYFFINFGVQSAGSLNIRNIAFLSQTSIGDLTDYSGENHLAEGTQYGIVKEGTAQTVSWTAEKLQWSKARLTVSGYSEGYRYLKLDFETQTGAQIGVYLGDTECWLPHTEYEAGSHTVWIPVPEGTPSGFILNFYFNVNRVGTAGSVTFTDISFEVEKPEEPQGVQIGALYDVASSVGAALEYTVVTDGDGQTVSWEDGRSEWAKVGMRVSGLNASEYRYLKLEFTVSRDVKIGLYDGTSYWLQETYAAGETHTVYVAVPESAGEEIDFEIYFDAGNGAAVAGSVTFTDISFEVEKPEEPQGVQIGALYDVASSVGVALEYTVVTDGDGQTVSWEDGRSEWAKVGMHVSGLDASEYRYLKLEFTVSRDVKIGLYDGTSYWLQETYAAGETHTVYVAVPESAGEEIDFEIYFDAGNGAAVAGSVTFTGIAFVTENPNA